MAATFYYIAFDGSWTVNLGTDSVRLGSGFSFTELAELGAVGGGSIVLDDPTDTVGHSSDAILGLQQFYVTESTASPIAIFRGWTRGRTYRRGQNDSLITGGARKIEVTLEDANTLAGRRIIQPKALDSSVARPSESPTARITWLLGTDYFSGVADNGLVSAASGTLDANDYSGQSAADVLNDCCVLTGDNWFVYWDRTAGAWSLAVFNFTTSTLNQSVVIFTNDLTLVDPTNNVFAIEPDATMTRDPSTIATGVLLPYAKGTVYRTLASSTFPDVDHTAPSTSVKTSTLADTQADRFLADNAAETDRFTFTAKIPVAMVNDAMAGQLVIGQFTHFPGYENIAQPLRIARRTVTQQELTDEFYTCTFEAIPAAPVLPTSSYAQLQRSSDQYTSSTGGGSPIYWSGTGDNPPSGFPSLPKFGLMDYDNSDLPAGSVGAHAQSGIKMLGGGNVDIYCRVTGYWGMHGASSGTTITVKFKGGATITSVYLADPATGIHIWSVNQVLTATSVAVSNGDIIEVNFALGRSEGTGMPGSAWAAAHIQVLTVSGDLT